MSRKPGPKTEVADGLDRVTLTLDPMSRRRLRVLGDGNESKGAREAARVAFERYQASTEATRRGPRAAMTREQLITWLTDASADDSTHPAAQAARLLSGAA